MPLVVTHLIDCTAKTVTLGVLGVALVYYWKISPEANGLLDRLLLRRSKS